MIVIVALVGAYRQNTYGNVHLRDAAVIGVLSPLGVLIGVAVSNAVGPPGARTVLRRARPVHRLRAVSPRPQGAPLNLRQPNAHRYPQSVDSLTWETGIPRLRSPILVCSFRGWNDAAGAASTALAAVAASFDAELVAQIDPEEYFDFQETRPTITLSEGQARHIEWPQNNLIAISVPSAERDLVLLDGTEPNLRWRTFSETVATAADALGVELVITMGALIAEVSHTLPVPITSFASDERLVEDLDLQRSTYEGRPASSGSCTTAAARWE